MFMELCIFLFLVNFLKNELEIEIKIESIESKAKVEKICNNLTVKSKKGDVGKQSWY